MFGDMLSRQSVRAIFTLERNDGRMAHQGLVSHNNSGVRREAVRIRLLGGFTLSVGTWTVEADRWRLKKATSLVKLLALAPRHSLHREQVADVLWPGADTKRAAN